MSQTKRFIPASALTRSSGGALSSSSPHSDFTLEKLLISVPSDFSTLRVTSPSAFSLSQ